MEIKPGAKQGLKILGGLALAAIAVWFLFLREKPAAKSAAAPATASRVLNANLPFPSRSPANSPRRSPASHSRPAGAAAKAPPELLDSLQTPPDEKGSYSVIEVYKTSDRFKVVRVRKDWKTLPDGTPVLTFTSRMPANHILVKLAPGADANSLEEYAERVGGRIARTLGATGLVVMEFDGRTATAMDKLIADLQKRPDLVSSGMPNYIVQLSP